MDEPMESDFRKVQVGTEDLPDVVKDRVALLESLEIDTRFHRFMAHSPDACNFYWGAFYSDFFQAKQGIQRDLQIIRLRLAALSGCPFCREQDVAGAREAGVNDDTIADILDPAILRHGLGWDPTRVQAASLDHAFWFHASPRADDWFLYDQRCPWTGNARAVAQGSMYAADGRLIATIVQEGLLRVPR